MCQMQAFSGFDPQWGNNQFCKRVAESGITACFSFKIQCSNPECFTPAEASDEGASVVVACGRCGRKDVYEGQSIDGIRRAAMGQFLNG